MDNRIGILGSGIVGRTLANGLNDVGYKIMISNRTGHKVDDWNGEVKTYSEVANFAKVLILCVKGSTALDLIKSLRKQLNGKIIIDTTNPLADLPRDDEVIKFFTTLDRSLMEQFQEEVPEASFVKAFNITGNTTMVNPKYKEGKPTMFICGNDKKSKEFVSNILDKLGWESEDFGSAKSARAIEPLCILWCIPGFMGNEWSHAFKLLHKK